GKKPVVGSRCSQHAEHERAADIDDHRSPGKCLTDTPRHKTGQPESDGPAENAAKGNPHRSVDRVHRMPRSPIDPSSLAFNAAGSLILPAAIVLNNTSRR